MKKNLLFVFFIIATAGVLVIYPQGFDDKLPYEKAWKKKDFIFFQNRIEEMESDEYEEIINKNLILSDITNVYYLDVDYYKTIQKNINSSQEDIIKKNSSFFWKQYIQSKIVFDNTKEVMCDTLFFYNHVYDKAEEISIRNIFRETNDGTDYKSVRTLLAQA